MMRFKYTLKYPLAALLLAGAAHAQTGVSDDRVSLPEGPGSLEGVGDNGNINPNMGSMRYSVPIDVPAGFAGLTPSLAFAYDSSGGNGMAGIGWSMSQPFIERMTNWGLPGYTEDDDFVANGGDQLVRISDGEPAVYRARFEGGFSRYLWHNRGDGTGGYWEVQSPDGIVSYFGATAAGQIEDDALGFGRQGATFRYHLVEKTDPFGHRAEYRYSRLDGLPYLTQIAYTFTVGDSAGSTVTFEYAEREDQLSDARSGSTEIQGRRITAVNVFAGDVRMWRYMVDYEDYADSGGLSRVRRIYRLGLNETPHPIDFSFEYSKGLGADCQADCDAPYLVDMGALGINLSTGNATLIDMNGDALPDIIDTSVEGNHRIFFNSFQARDQHVFEAPQRTTFGTRASHQLSSAYVQVLDANGDGRADIVNVQTGQVLYNLGTGDWTDAEDLSTNALPDFGEDFAVGAEELAHVRFFDYDNDRRIDVLKSNDVITTVHHNLGDAGFELAPDVEFIGMGFADANLDLSDMNGDGLLDPVQITGGQVRYRINLGFGRWSNTWREINNLPFTADEASLVQLEDINGDSLSDIVLIQGGVLQYGLNRGGDRFDDFVSIETVDGQALPSTADGTQVLFADMNGSGSDDVVWVSPAGNVTYLELFPLRPNLLTRIENGLGLITEISYSTQTEQLALDPNGWVYKLPFPMIMASAIDVYDSLQGVHHVQEFTYHDAYYDTEEKAYRGFARVEQLLVGDESQLSGLKAETYDLGVDDRYRKGKLLTRQIYSKEADGTLVPLNAVVNSFDDCDVDGLGAGPHSYPIRSICQTGTQTTTQEGAPEGDWATTLTELEYDGYGNVTESAEHGVTQIGGDGCADNGVDSALSSGPSGGRCLGDERFTRTEFVGPESDGGRWIIGRPARRFVGATRDDAASAETVYHYDGDAFVGLEVGRLTDGVLTHVEAKTAAGAYLSAVRYENDEHGKRVAMMGPRGEPGTHGFTTRYSYDAEHLLISQTDRELNDAQGNPYILRQDFEYDPVWGVVSAHTNWRALVGGDAVTPTEWSRIEYDDIARTSARYFPGDEAGRPTTSYDFEYGAVVSRAITSQRTVANSAQPDSQMVDCIDGLGREFTSYTWVGDDVWEANQYSVFNRSGQPIELYRGARADAANCMAGVPEFEPARSTYDGLSRPVTIELPDGALHGSASETRSEYGPLLELSYDAEDFDAESPNANTPVVRTFDGLGRIITVEHAQGGGAAPLVYRYEYDARSFLVAVTDAAGNRRSQVRDLAGRVIESTDPDRGAMTYAYDAASNPIRIEDAEGRVQRFSYDAMNRVTQRWQEDAEDDSLVETFYDLPSHCPDGVECAYGAGRRVGATFPLAESRAGTWLNYDSRGRLSTTTHLIGGEAFEFVRENDNLGQTRALTLPDGTRLDFERDGTGRITAIGDFVERAEFERAGLIRSLRLTNGVEASWQYNAMDQVARRQVSGADGDLLDLQYTYTRKGMISRVEDRSAVEGQAGLAAQYTYDALSRLVGATLDSGRDTFEETLTYRYDVAHNLIDKSSTRGAGSRSHVGVLTYGEQAGPHAVTGAGALALSYDDAGLLVGRGNMNLSWDYARRLVGASVDAEQTAQFFYNADSRRYLSEEGARFRYTLSPFFEIEDGMALVTVRLGKVHVATKESAGIAARILSDLVDDDVIDAADAVLAETNQEGSPTDRLLRASVRRLLLRGESRSTFNHHDHYDNVVVTTDASGAVTTRRSFDPHGMERTSNTGDRAYNGHHTDGTGLVLMGARYYDPSLGRWTAPDPGFEQISAALSTGRPQEATAPYLYNLNNPVSYRDPSGLVADPNAPQFDAREFESAVSDARVLQLAESGDANTVVLLITQRINHLDGLAQTAQIKVDMMRSFQERTLDNAIRELTDGRPLSESSRVDATDLIKDRLQPSPAVLRQEAAASELRRTVKTLRSGRSKLKRTRKAVKANRVAFNTFMKKNPGLRRRASSAQRLANSLAGGVDPSNKVDLSPKTRRRR